MIRKMTTNELKQDSKLVQLMRNAVQSSADDSGWANLGPVGQNIAKHSPDFDPRNYGYDKLGELVRATKLFELEERQIGNTNSRNLYVRAKKSGSRAK